MKSDPCGSNGVFVERLNRFVAIVDVEGREELVHVPNTGRMRELLVPGASVILREAGKPERKTRYDLWLVQYQGHWVCVDSRTANDLVEELLRSVTAHGRPAPVELDSPLTALQPLLRGVEGVRREARFGTHRFDFALTKRDAQVPVEVKSVNLVQDGAAKFPDAPTVRGVRHVQYLRRWVERGGEAHILFIVQRGDARVFRPNSDTDPAFAAALRDAQKAGVGLAALGCDVCPLKITVARSLPVELE